MTTWKHNTYKEVEDARVALEMALEVVHGAEVALREAQRHHRAAEAVHGIEDRNEALDELADRVGSYELAEAILAYDREDEEPEPAPE